MNLKIWRAGALTELSGGWEWRGLHLFLIHFQYLEVARILCPLKTLIFGLMDPTVTPNAILLLKIKIYTRLYFVWDIFIIMIYLILPSFSLSLWHCLPWLILNLFYQKSWNIWSLKWLHKHLNKNIFHTAQSDKSHSFFILGKLLWHFYFRSPNFHKIYGLSFCCRRLNGIQGT